MKQDYAAYTEIIRARVSTSDLGKDYGLQVGRDGRCRCIFCDGGRDDTLRLYPGDRGYYCFRCHERGDVISLYQKLTGAGFRQAVQDLNDQYGLGLPLNGGDQQAMEKARHEADERKRKRAEEQERQRQLYQDYLDAADAVWILEQNRIRTAPQTPTDPWKQRFVISLRYLEELRDHRDRLFDQLHSS